MPFSFGESRSNMLWTSFSPSFHKPLWWMGEHGQLQKKHGMDLALAYGHHWLLTCKCSKKNAPLSWGPGTYMKAGQVSIRTRKTANKCTRYYLSTVLNQTRFPSCPIIFFPNKCLNQLLFHLRVNSQQSLTNLGEHPFHWSHTRSKHVGDQKQVFQKCLCLLNSCN